MLGDKRLMELLADRPCDFDDDGLEVEEAESPCGDVLFTIERRKGLFFVRLYCVLPHGKMILVSEEEFSTATAARERLEQKVEMHYQTEAN
jgi:hypothetical protein